MAVEIPHHGQLDLGIRRHQREKVRQKLLLAFARDILRRAIFEKILFLPVHLEAPHERMSVYLGIRLRQLVEPVQLLLYIFGVLRGGIIPHLAVEYANKRSVRHPLLVFRQNAVFVNDSRSMPAFRPYVGVKSLPEPIHCPPPFML